MVVSQFEARSFFFLSFFDNLTLKCLGRVFHIIREFLYSWMNAFFGTTGSKCSIMERWQRLAISTHFHFFFLFGRLRWKSDSFFTVDKSRIIESSPLQSFTLLREWFFLNLAVMVLHFFFGEDLLVVEGILLIRNWTRE